MKYLLFIPLLLSLSSGAYSQRGAAVNLQDHQASVAAPGVFKINFIPLSISYEQRLASTHTLLFEGGLGLESRFDNNTNNLNFLVHPYLDFNYRYYYNFEKRNLKGKRTIMNSGNYWGVLARFFLDPVYNTVEGDYQGPFLLIGPVWGMQRNYKSHFSLGFRLGGG